MQDAPQFLFRRIGFGEQEVVADRTAHERIALRNIHEVPAGRLARRRRTARQIKRDISGRRCDKTEHQAEQRRLPDTRFPDKGGFRTRLEIVREMRNDFTVALGVAEGHIIEVHTCGDVRNGDALPRALHNRLGPIFQFLKPFDARR